MRLRVACSVWCAACALAWRARVCVACGCVGVWEHLLRLLLLRSQPPGSAGTKNPQGFDTFYEYQKSGVKASQDLYQKEQYVTAFP